MTNRLQEQFGYGYDAAHNLNSRTNNALIQTFNVNSLDELTTITRNSTNVLTVTGSTGALATNVSVSDGTVNRTAVLYNDSTFAATNFTPANGSNTYTATAQDSFGRASTNSVTAYLPASASYTYDLNGNLLSDGTRNFAYDDENELIYVWVTNVWKSQFVYDGRLRRRITREYTWQGGAWLQTNETHYVYDGNLVVQERDINNLPTVAYTRGIDFSGKLQKAGGIGGLVGFSQLSSVNSQHCYYHCDGNGNVTVLINSLQLYTAKYLYDPYGNVLAKIGPLADVNLYQFSSRELHLNSGLTSFGHRFYDPILQRWLNRDPITESGGVNLYGFVANAPIALFDIFGLTPGTDSFSNPVGAGRDAVNTANPISIQNNLENGGWILQAPNGTYQATYPSNNGPTGFDLSSVPVPQGYRRVGDYHCHGDYSRYTGPNSPPMRTSRSNQDDYNSDYFSGNNGPTSPRDADIPNINLANQAYGPGYIGILGTPSGRILEYDPSSGLVTQIGTSPTPNNPTSSSPFLYEGPNVSNPPNQYTPTLPVTDPGYIYMGPSDDSEASN